MRVVWKYKLNQGLILSMVHPEGLKIHSFPVRKINGGHLFLLSSLGRSMRKLQDLGWTIPMGSQVGMLNHIVVSLPQYVVTD